MEKNITIEDYYYAVDRAASAYMNEYQPWKGKAYDIGWMIGCGFEKVNEDIEDAIIEIMRQGRYRDDD